jgi:alkanesulfonate monooxygenase SsuD/methylene tetrahydromethanopterin reductase-like flavin-dependent oxidoreductase (luciferase family)
VYAPTKLQKSWLDGVRAAANRYGYDAAPSQLGALFPIHVADTNAEAHAAAEKHISWLFKKGLKHKLEYLYPPGYMSMGGMRAAMTSGLKPFGEYSYRELVDEGFVIAGSPESVREQLLESQGTLGFGTLATLLQFGDMPNDRARASMELFASEVMPALKSAAPVVAVAP